MRTSTRLFLCGSLLATLTGSAQAEPWAHVDSSRTHAIHVNVFRPLSLQARLEALASRAVAADTNVELSMFVGKTEALVDPEGYVYPEEGGCIDILVGSIIDAGCGALTVTVDDALGTTRVVGTIETTAYEYIPDPFEFREIGPSSIAIDVTFAATGALEPSPYSSVAAGVCGLPPETKGVFLDARPEVRRSAPGTGSLVSSSAGPVNIRDFSPLRLEVLALAGAGGYDACL